MEDVTHAELVRRVTQVERRQVDADTRYVLEAVYVRDMAEVRGDLSEIKESQKWSARLIIAQFITLLVTLVVIALTGGIG